LGAPHKLPRRQNSRTCGKGRRFPSARRGSRISTRTCRSVTDMTAVPYLRKVVVARPAAEIQRTAAPGRRPFSDVSHYVFREPDGPGPARALTQLAQQALGGPLVAPALDQHVEHHPSLIHGTPKPVLHPTDLDD